MASSREAALKRAKLIAQDDGAGVGASGLALLLRTGDYDEAVTQGLRAFDQDRPNRRVVDVTVTATGFRFPLTGGSAFAALTGANAWAAGLSLLKQLWWPWDNAVQGAVPIDQKLYQVVQTPGDIFALEFFVDRPRTGDVIRLDFTAPHVLTDAPSATCTVRDFDLDSFVLLVASLILRMAAVRAVQNTGTSALPGDITDRRTQSDQFASRAKDLYARYQQSLGLAGATPSTPASTYFDVASAPQSGLGWLWPRRHT